MYEDILQWVNVVRTRRGIGPCIEELPKGTPLVPSCCTLANALGGAGNAEVFPSIGGGHVYFPLDDKPGRGEDACMEDMPEHVSLFGLKFDDGQYPDLIA